MKTSFIVLTTISFIFGCKAIILKKSDSILRLIDKAGYKGEAHQVETEDGYYLKIHRVLPNSNGTETIKKPVFLLHGLVATAADFLLTGPNVALSYLLADNGHDVWIGNCRGSRHSTKHRNYSSDSKEYWNFSWHEIGYYDLPTMLDYMLYVNGANQALYAGHSQGTTALLVLLSTRPEYNQKIVQGHLMAPSAFRKKKIRSNLIINILKNYVKL